ncbi:MAG: transcriptional regulator NrdR [Ruminococcaceae bacterium]|nr:transcriptional regulator NrdR [Oscillospiraceae bacterium]
MKCPYCEYLESKVIDSRPIDDGSSIRRRRECLKCEKRFTTYEQIESVPLVIIKKDGKRQVYNRQKLLNGLLRACEKTPVSFAQIENMVLEIESVLNNSLDREVTSTEIGELVMDKLKKINDIAYVRFASVYREFRDVNTFMEELSTLIHSK